MSKYVLEMLGGNYHFVQPWLTQRICWKNIEALDHFAVGQQSGELLGLGELWGAADRGPVGDIHHDLVPEQGDREAGIVSEGNGDDDNICGCDPIKTTDTNPDGNNIAE